VVPRGVLAAFLLIVPIAAQAAGPARDTPASPAPAVAFPSQVEEVFVTVTITDKSGRPVTDLRAEDFVISENGRVQKVHLFARAVEPEGEPDERQQALALDLGMLMDTSESMLKELKRSQQAAVRFLEAIPRARELITVFFDEEIRVSQYNSENQQGLFERIHEAKGGGNTALYDAMAVYLSRIQGASGRKTLILFTDGEDTRSDLNVSELVRLVRASPVTIYPISFSTALGPGSVRALRANSFLDHVAELSGGKVFSPRSFRDLPAIYRQILDELASQYVIGYVSDDPRRDGTYRKLKVAVSRPELKVRSRAGYYAPEE
jgi:Ca-activated chloride channel homolog